MAGVRERVRNELTAEIKRLAREQIAVHGAAELSLRAIARDLDMVSSAIYRYFASRDQLLTALIIDCYDDLGAVVEQAEAACARNDHVGRWLAIATSIRRWALGHPHDYALIFGTPVPGYAAPQDTIGPASRYTLVMLRLLVDLHAAGFRPEVTVTPAAATEFADLRARLQVEVDDRLLLVGLAAWANVIGLVSFELFGHLHNVIDDLEAHFVATATMLGERLVVPPPVSGTARPRRTSKKT